VSLKNTDNTLTKLTGDDWEVKENKNPVGVYIMKENGRMGITCGSYDNVFDMERMKNDVRENPEGISSFVVRQFINGEFITDVIIDDGSQKDNEEFINQKLNDDQSI
jgi:hypothetical protein